MTEEAHTTIAPATASRRAVVTGVAAVPLAAVPFASKAADDPIVLMLRRRNEIVEAFGQFGDADDIVSAQCDEKVAFERTVIIGTPILSLAGAALAFDAFRQESCCDALDEWLLEAISTFFREAAA